MAGSGDVDINSPLRNRLRKFFLSGAGEYTQNLGSDLSITRYFANTYFNLIVLCSLCLFRILSNIFAVTHSTGMMPLLRFSIGFWMPFFHLMISKIN